MSDLTKLTLEAALGGMAKGEFSSVELTQAHVDACADAGKLNAFITDTHELALEQAKASDARRAKGEAGLLEGAPLGIKDLFCTDGVKTCAGSKILGDFEPTYESSVTANMKADGMVMLGKLNLDAGGSIRQPASFTGTVGIKPTYGRCSRWGTVAFASSLDQAGPIAKTVIDAAILLESMAGYDAKDSTSLNLPVPKWSESCGKSVKGMRIGIPKEYSIEGMPPEIQSLWDKGVEMMKDAGAEIVPITLPHTKYALPAYYVVAPAEASSNLARYDGMRYGLRVDGKDLNDTYDRTRTEGFGDEVRISTTFSPSRQTLLDCQEFLSLLDLMMMDCHWVYKLSAKRWMKIQYLQRQARLRKRLGLRLSLRSGGSDEKGSRLFSLVAFVLDSIRVGICRLRYGLLCRNRG